MTTVYGWDVSHYDWARGSVDVHAAAAAGIVFTTHKVCEGDRFFQDPYYGQFAARAHGVLPLSGGYMVNHPGDQRPQVDWFVGLLDTYSSWWRATPFLVQLDAEKFQYMSRAPSPQECQQWCDYFVASTGGTHIPMVYGPRWLYGDTLSEVTYPLWASNYGTNPVGDYRPAYPGDQSTRWAAYSGKVPAVLQYGSRLTIGSQKTCDANAYRGSVEQLIALTYRGSSPIPTPTPTPSPSPMPGPDWTTEMIMSLPTLAKGASGQFVRNLQALLGTNGHTTGVDGSFGPLTDASVRAFQQQHRLSVDGIVGRNTWTTLIIGRDQ